MGVKQVFMQVKAPLSVLGGFLASAAETMPGRKRANRAAPALSSEWQRELGVGQNWTPLSYGEYYPRSSLVYSAIKIRQDAISRVPLRVYQSSAGLDRMLGTGAARASTRAEDASTSAVGPMHPAQRILDSPNPFWTRGDLWRATETYLGLWGSAFWGLERDEAGAVIEIWPLRPDRTRVVPDASSYIKGFVYVGQGRELVPYVPEDMVWLRYFNPLDEYSGLSPMAPLRLSADMGLDALRANRNSLSNESMPGLFIETSATPTDHEVNEFYQRWESRYRGPDRSRRPALLSGGMKAANLGFSPKDMEYLGSLRWSLEDVSRVYGVPKAMLADIERISVANFSTARKVFWEDTIIPQLSFYREALQQMLLPNFADPGLHVDFDVAEIEALQESENDRASRRRAYVTTGIMTVNEVRREMNLPPLPWGDGPRKAAGSAGGEVAKK